MLELCQKLPFFLQYIHTNTSLVDIKCAVSLDAGSYPHASMIICVYCIVCNCRQLYVISNK
jgi:hypothetical protein